MQRIVKILHVQTNLGLRPGGVERSVRLCWNWVSLNGRCEEVHTLRAPSFQQERDPSFGTRNLEAIAQLARSRLTGRTDPRWGAFPLVLGGDDSVLMGCLLAMRRRGSPGLMFIDGHTDFWDLPKSLAGEFSESDLWVATGHGPDVVANLEGLRPLVDPRASAIYGHRDRSRADRPRQRGCVPPADACAKPRRISQRRNRRRRPPRRGISRRRRSRAAFGCTSTPTASTMP